ncbi:5-hydroxytryptamine receptor 1F [Desmophyllum pertusum]|uniref:5-hydroxytryptamine receptor 1F n=1 Tax=Desmophyllum pertusum TaxID=174260 RepID=A0A9W9ZMI5_9CNID|nr:5-hydroxytryptamine receptor 1F [Desmophyllum pertusum]
MWMIAILPVFIPSIFPASIVTSVVIIIIYQAVVYCEACRHEKQIIAQQVSLEAREKFKKEKKALKTTTKIIVAVAMCYLPPIISKIVLKKLLNDAFSSSIEFQVVSVWTTVTILNSLFNPLIYTVRNRQFRVAFVQLLLRKTLQEAEEIERKLFGSANVVGIIEAAHEQRMGLEA